MWCFCTTLAVKQREHFIGYKFADSFTFFQWEKVTHCRLVQQHARQNLLFVVGLFTQNKEQVTYHSVRIQS